MTTVDWGAAKVMKADGFDDASNVVELGAGDFSRSLSLGERFAEKHFLSTDYEMSAKANANLDIVAQMPNVEAAKLDARSPDLPDESVDFMFSIALMEHIAELDQCLESVYRVLRPGGVYFYIQAPFWSCSQGHHFRHWDDVTFDFIPKYSHLTRERDEMREALAAGPPPPFDIDACVEGIYGRPDLSRLGLRQTRSIVEASSFELVSWVDTPDRRYDEQAARDAFPHLRFPFAFEELVVSGAEVTIRKPHRKPSRWESARSALSKLRSRRS